MIILSLPKSFKVGDSIDYKFPDRPRPTRITWRDAKTLFIDEAGTGACNILMRDAGGGADEPATFVTDNGETDPGSTKVEVVLPDLDGEYDITMPADGTRVGTAEQRRRQINPQGEAIQEVAGVPLPDEMSPEEKATRKKQYMEQQKTSKALFKWFESQGISEQEAVGVMMQASGIIVASARSERELEQNLAGASNYFAAVTRNGFKSDVAKLLRDNE